MDPLALADLRTAAELFDRMVAGRRLELLLVALFAGVFLLLAALGIYRAVSWSVAQRSREIVIRVAVGASRPTVLRKVVREGVSLSALGTSIGLGIFVFFRLGLTCLCEENNLPWYDPALVALASLLMLAVGALVSWLPAARAVRLDLGAELRDR
jgi:putative ABC transport system permease protein